MLKDSAHYFMIIKELAAIYRDLHYIDAQPELRFIRSYMRHRINKAGVRYRNAKRMEKRCWK